MLFSWMNWKERASDRQGRNVMFQRHYQRKQLAKHLRARMESCVDTILQLDKHLGQGRIKPEVIERFEQLREMLSHVPEESVEERYVFQIEEATNQLLAEIRSAFADKKALLLHDGHIH